MPGDPSPAPDQVLDAASVLLVREFAGNLEVFVVERHPAGAFAGVLAYPGGKVEHADRTLAGDLHAGLDLGEATRRWGLDPEDEADRSRVLGWYVAAAREVFEEVGLLLALQRHRDGALGPPSPSIRAAADLDGARDRLASRGSTWDWTGWLREHDLVLDLARLHPWSRWITPVGEPRRFDTMFLLASLEDAEHEVLAHDQVEVVDARWLAPSTILAERAQGRSVVIYPTRRQLVGLPGQLSQLSSAIASRDLRVVQPTLAVDGEGAVLAHHPHDGTVEPVF